MEQLKAKIEAARNRCGAAVMGVLNITPDSFSDAGRYIDPVAARTRIEELLAEGADILDIGAESSRPGAHPVSASEQIARLVPAVETAVGRNALVSIDTTSPEVAEAMLRLGVHLINDVSCLANPALARVVAHFGAHLVIMHTRGALGSMSGFSCATEESYGDLVGEIRQEWLSASARAEASGLPRDRIWFDPGLGFAKSARHSLDVLRRLREFADLRTQIVVGPSRKSFISAVDPSEPGDRLGGTIAACIVAVQRGASVLRVHDVRAVRQALLIARASAEGDPAGG